MSPSNSQNTTEAPSSDTPNDTTYLTSIISDQLRLLTNCMAERDRASTERDRACEERDAATAQCAKYYHDIQLLTSTISRLEEQVARQDTAARTHANKTRELEKQVNVLSQQVAGKRAVWFEHNPRSGGRSGGKSVRSNNPFATPTKMGPLVVFGNGGSNAGTPTKMGRTVEEAMADALAGGQPITAQLLSRFDSIPPSPQHLGPVTPASGELPCGPAKPCTLNTYASTASRVISACNGVAQNGIDTFPATSLIPFESNEELIAGFVATFDDVYLMVCGWVTTYADKINPIDEKDIGVQPRCWAYMLSCLSPLGEKDAAFVIGSFQRDTATRRWFVMRMVVQYIHLHVWSYTTWLGYSDASDADLNRICKKLAEKGVTLDQRGELLAERSLCVSAIMGTQDYRGFRKYMIAQHTKKLRDILPLVLNPGINRSDAGRDLAVVVAKAFDLSAQLFTCGWTFIISMPEAGAKFAKPSMRARNSDVEPLDLQMRGMRIRFAVTPFVTLRDDSGLAIVTRNIDRSSVLIEQ
ncbi:hypothetical protein VC83_00795 [Pseudogymnoascus destructans]|uniref:Uncharacterized protein n=2 Tax=Pseudogymnoascus destructans TaxID=655981 RepID=L8FSW3_PSED2|nr:uncharacterized protein VC83_00795 [Pseudogymnoascus destructans]ELR02806.1 hypothetical protein GMDG_05743 [Pseudogymnoascus destructans 20631-21]OAF62319.1 hypothetical protein VC83_00795 [Pseudogymnoascus destructans]